MNGFARWRSIREATSVVSVAPDVIDARGELFIRRRQEIEHRIAQIDVGFGAHDEMEFCQRAFDGFEQVYVQAIGSGSRRRVPLGRRRWTHGNPSHLRFFL